jgi:hypothetical protein
MIDYLIKHYVTSGIGLGLILTMIFRIINNAKLITFWGKIGQSSALLVYNLGNLLSIAGRNISQKATLKFGKKIWERIEDFLENSIIVSASAFYTEYKKIIPNNTLEFLWLCFSIKGFDNDNGIDKSNKDDTNNGK